MPLKLKRKKKLASFSWEAKIDYRSNNKSLHPRKNLKSVLLLYGVTPLFAVNSPSVDTNISNWIANYNWSDNRVILRIACSFIVHFLRGSLARVRHWFPLGIAFTFPDIIFVFWACLFSHAWFSAVKCTCSRCQRDITWECCVNIGSCGHA